MTDHPNLLIVMVDQMQASLLSDSPPVRLPVLSDLRQVSIRFRHAFTTAPICTPARASFQMGLPVAVHGVLGNNRPMPPGLTLPDRLNAAGYATSYIGKWHLDARDGRGWTRFSDGKKLHPPDPGYGVMRDGDAPHHGVAPYGIDEHVDGRIAAHACDELKQLRRSNRPFALMVSFFGPHAPYFLPVEWHDRYDPASLPLPDDFDDPMQRKPAIQSRFRCRAWGQTWSPEKFRAIRATYFGYAAMLDHLVGRLLDLVDLDRTAVLFLSDHGEMNGHHRMIYKGPMMYEQLVRVPALLHLPGQAQTHDDDRLIDLTDLSRTMLALGGGASQGFGGHDLTDATWGGRDHVVSEFYEANWVKPIVQQRVAMIRDRRWKYVVTEGDVHELYDLHDQISEVRNLIDDPAQERRIASMRDELARHVPWTAVPDVRDKRGVSSNH